MIDAKDRVPAGQLAGILEFPCGVERLENGNTLVADAGSEAGIGSELIEVDPAGRVVWHWDGGTRFLHGVKALPGGRIALADTTNDRILAIDRSGAVVFTSEDWGGGSGILSDGSRLHYPNNIHPLADDRFMVTDRNNDRFVVVDAGGRVERAGYPGLKRPHNCEPLPGGGVLVANSDENSVDEFDADGRRVWRYDEGLDWPRDANRLENGNTLIADSKNSRVIEVTPDKRIAWAFTFDHFANVYEAHRLENGNTLITDQQRQQVIEVTPEGETAWSFRNYRREFPVYERLVNGSFKPCGPDGMPEGWHLGVRFSEGGGGLVWGQDRQGKRIPGLAYDRGGGLYLQQTVRVQPGAFYTLAGRLGVEDLDGSACLQVAFADAYGGLICDASRSPRGESFSGSVELTRDMLEVEAPPGSAAANVRVFISGRGRVFFDEIRFFG